MFVCVNSMGYGMGVDGLSTLFSMFYFGSRGAHPGVLDIRGRRDFSRFDPSPRGRPHFTL